MQTERVRHPRLAFLGLAAASVMSAVSTARADVLGPYVGGAVGQGRIDTGSLTAPAAPPFTTTPTSVGSFTENHSAWKLVAGIRAIAVIGAEVEYLDLGHPSRSFSSPSVSGTADVKMRGGGAFGMVYLPVPVVTAYVKAGLARLQATLNVAGQIPGVGTCVIGNPNCALVSRRYSATDTSFAAGVGAQVKLGPLAMRAEYERFSAARGNPGLASVGVFWTF